ncbi:MAG: hypothetical protein HC913_11340 [Microscillaceae bacterium]|nr:hypothetical protein [Microscillaceae bacterium]
MLPVFEWRTSNELYLLGWLLGMFFWLAWVNLLLISLFELTSDTQDQQSSTARALGLEKTRLFVKGLLWLGSLWWLAGVFFLIGLAPWALGLLGLMGMSLWLVYLHPNWFAPHEYYRIACDAIFCYPVLLLFN